MTTKSMPDETKAPSLTREKIADVQLHAVMNGDATVARICAIALRAESAERSLAELQKKLSKGGGNDA